MNLKDDSKEYLVKRASDLMPSDPASIKILRQRAELIAKKEEKEIKTKDLIKYIRFRLGKKEYYGISDKVVMEVIRKSEVTKLPAVPSYVAGVINWQGKLLAVLDLKEFLKLKANNQSSQDKKILILKYHHISLGILVDQVEGMDAYDKELIDKPIESHDAIKKEYIIGLHNGITAILNTEKILMDLDHELNHSSNHKK